MSHTHIHSDGHHHHSHGAGAHGTRAHEGRGGLRRLLIALAILGTFTVIEGVGGYFANSIALLAEAAHMLADSSVTVTCDHSHSGRKTTGKPQAHLRAPALPATHRIH